jgi:CRP-like cAMP-binding protein
MFATLKAYCQSLLPFTAGELALIDTHFTAHFLDKGELLLRQNKTCTFLAFVSTGCIRHFYVKEGIAHTCEISPEQHWVTDFRSFQQGTPAIMNLEALEKTEVFLVQKEALQKLYAQCEKFETFGRLMTEQIVQRATERTMSLTADTPEERFQNLVSQEPQLLQRVPQKYLASLLGIRPESLSRIRARVARRRT